ncbi:hypothetical protein ACJX0J_009414, partial [Zea mays]
YALSVQVELHRSEGREIYFILCHFIFTLMLLAAVFRFQITTFDFAGFEQYCFPDNISLDNQYVKAVVRGGMFNYCQFYFLNKSVDIACAHILTKSIENNVNIKNFRDSFVKKKKKQQQSKAAGFDFVSSFDLYSGFRRWYTECCDMFINFRTFHRLSAYVLSTVVQSYVDELTCINIEKQSYRCCYASLKLHLGFIAHVIGLCLELKTLQSAENTGTWTRSGFVSGNMIKFFKKQKVFSDFEVVRIMPIMLQFFNSGKYSIHYNLLGINGFRKKYVGEQDPAQSTPNDRAPAHA